MVDYFEPGDQKRLKIQLVGKPTVRPVDPNPLSLERVKVRHMTTSMPS
jgi:hypothetical protein